MSGDPAHFVSQWQGTVICLLLAAGWTWSGVMRHKELLRQRCMLAQDGTPLSLHPPARTTTRRRSHDNLQQLHTGNTTNVLPGVTVVLPVCGCRATSAVSWRSQLSMAYDGPLEFVFVVRDKSDSAHAALQQLLADRCAAGIGRDRPTRILVAGDARRCSQKIHNFLYGMRAARPSSAYVLQLDDDITVPPTLLQQLMGRMLSDPAAWMATGYPFDVPPVDSTLAAYCVLVYHLPLLIAFSIREHHRFIWGGCMLMPLADLRDHDRYGFVKAWEDGGYSDDLIVASTCSQHGLTILCPSFAVFPQRVQPDCSASAYLNYLHRQLYVMDTYATSHNRAINHAMAAIHTYLSASFVAAIVAGVWQMVGHAFNTRPGLPIPSLCLAASLLVAQGGLYWMTTRLCALWAAMLPHAPADVAQFDWCKVWLAFFIENALLPWVFLWVFLCPTVEWSGVRYSKRCGRVVAVQHMP